MYRIAVVAIVILVGWTSVAHSAVTGNVGEGAIGDPGGVGGVVTQSQGGGVTQSSGGGVTQSPGGSVGLISGGSVTQNPGGGTVQFSGAGPDRISTSAGVGRNPGSYADHADFSLLLLSISVFVFSGYLLWNSYRFEFYLNKFTNREEEDTGFPPSIFNGEQFILLIVIMIFISLWIYRLSIMFNDIETFNGMEDFLIYIFYFPANFVPLPLVLSTLLSAIASAKFLLSMFMIRAHEHESEFPIHSVGASTSGMTMSIVTFAGSIASIVGLMLVLD